MALCAAGPWQVRGKHRGEGGGALGPPHARSQSRATLLSALLRESGAQQVDGPAPRALVLGWASMAARALVPGAGGGAGVLGMTSAPPPGARSSAAPDPSLLTGPGTQPPGVSGSRSGSAGAALGHAHGWATLRAWALVPLCSAEAHPPALGVLLRRTGLSRPAGPPAAGGPERGTQAALVTRRTPGATARGRLECSGLGQASPGWPSLVFLVVWL